MFKKENKFKATTMEVFAHFADIPMFYIKYLAMQKVQMHAGAISKFLYG